MATRRERYKAKRKSRAIKFMKFNLIISLFILMFISIYKVNDYIIELNVIENPDVFSIDVESRSISIFGVKYYLNLDLRPD